jgi:hypothetical protein
MSGKYTLSIVQGSTLLLNITWKDSTGTVIPLTTMKVRMQVRSRTADGTVVLDLDNYDKGGITIANDIITIKATANQTALIPQDEYLYDVELEDLTGTVYNLLYGNVKFRREITHG